MYGCLLVFRDCRGVWGAFYVRECLRLSCVSSPGYTPAAEKLQRPINAAVCPGGVEEEETERGRGRGNLNRGLQQICSLILSLDSRGCVVQSDSSREWGEPCRESVAWQNTGEDVCSCKNII